MVQSKHIEKKKQRLNKYFFTANLMMISEPYLLLRVFTKFKLLDINQWIEQNYKLKNIPIFQTIL